MYSALLTLHSILRWIVVIGVIYTLYRAYTGISSSRSYSTADEKAGRVTVVSAHIQLIIGLILYIVSPVTKYFISNFSAAVKVKDIRFYGMEHTIVMILAVACITIGSAVSKKKTEDKAKFKALALWLTIAFILMLLMVPWPISPFSERPWLRL